MQQMEEVLRSAIDNHELTGANMMVLHQGKELFYHEDGYADLDNKMPLKRDTIFRLYSMSKPITAAAAMILVERGIIDLFEPVEHFLPGFKNQQVMDKQGLVPVNRALNIMDLLSMTSGLLYGGDDETGRQTSAIFDEIEKRMMSDQPMTTVEAINRLGQVPLKFQPGSSWEYGTSADVLGAVIEVASGMRFGEFLEKELFEPIGASSLGFTIPEADRKRISTVYSGTNLGISDGTNPKGGFESGGAGLLGTIDDYKRFATMLLQKGIIDGRQVMKSETVKYMTTRTLNNQQQEAFDSWHALAGHSYGNFMRIVTDPSKCGIFSRKGEYGWDGWLGCYFANFPDEQVTFLLMMQKVDAGTTHLTRKLRNVLLTDELFM